MLKVRVTPTLLWKNLGLVKGKSFDSWRRVGAVLPSIKVYNLRDVDELIFLDITATTEEREPDCASLAEFAAECFVPLAIGGGVRTVGHIRDILKAGADKVCLNSAAYENPELIRQGAACFGSQCLVVSIDARKMPDGSYECYSHAGTRATGRRVGEWAQRVEELGAGEILITSIERDGTLQGYDLELIREVTRRVRIPVIASGGAGTYAHFLEAVRDGRASAVAAASMYHFTEQTPLEAKKYLASGGVLVRDVHRQLPAPYAPVTDGS